MLGVRIPPALPLLKVKMNKELNKKIATVSFIIVAAIALIVTRVLLQTAAASFGFVQKLWGQDLFQHGLPVSIAVITFVVLQFNPKIITWADEVISELLKVVWPSKQNTTAMTIVCCVMLIVSAVMLYIFDLVATNITQMLFELGKWVS